MKTKICSTLGFLVFFAFIEINFISQPDSYGRMDERLVTETKVSSLINDRNETGYLDSLLPDWTAVCDVSGTRFGEFVSAGDFNGDGFADIAVADGNYNSMGAVFIYFGSPSGPPIIPNQVIHGNGPGFSDNIDGTCDINNDGFNDLIIGDPWSGITGKVHIHYGSPTGLPDTANVVILPVGTDILDFGYSLASADLNGDGYSDVIATLTGQLDTLTVTAYIYNGSASGISGNYPSAVIAFDHPVYTQNRSCVGLGDLNRDGFDEVAILGHVGIFVIRGTDSIMFVRSHYRGYNFNGGVITASSAGDVNSDLYNDMLVRTGNEVYLFNGSSEAPGPLPDWTNPNGSCYIFSPVSSAGDFDNDGIDDVVVSDCESASLYTGSVPGLNIAWVKFLTTPLSITSGDINGDGYSDVIITEYNKVHAFYGRDLSALPVNIVQFSSVVKTNEVLLYWSTSTELNNSCFDIERANENEGWSKAGFVRGSGTTNEMREYSFTDRNLSTGKYKYRLKQLDFNGSFEYFELAEEVSIGIPDKYDLSQNYPNPFNPVTTINYDLPTDGIVTIKVFDMLGREMKTLVNERKTAGYYKLTFNASNRSSGAYFYRMTSGDFVAVKKFVVLK